VVVMSGFPACMDCVAGLPGGGCLPIRRSLHQRVFAKSALANRFTFKLGFGLRICYIAKHG
jgi:hypothetical protein